MKSSDFFNQSVYVSQNILEVSKETKRKNAYLKIAIPNELAEKLIKHMVGNEFYDKDKKGKIIGLQLCWNDTAIKENKQ